MSSIPARRAAKHRHRPAFLVKPVLTPAAALDLGQDLVFGMKGTGAVAGGRGIARPAHQLPKEGQRHGRRGYASEVTGAGVVLGVVETVGVHKMGVGAAQGRRFGVHAGSKGIHGPGNVHGQCHGGVVAADHHEAVEQVPQAEFFPGCQVHGGALGARRLGRHGDHGVQVLPRLQDQQGCHDLGGAGHGPTLVLVLPQEQPPAAGFHEGIRFGGDPLLLLSRPGRARKQQQYRQEQKGIPPYHDVPSSGSFSCSFCCRLSRTSFTNLGSWPTKRSSVES